MDYLRLISTLDRALIPPGEGAGYFKRNEFTEQGCYNYIPLDLEQFMDQLEVAKQSLTKRPDNAAPRFVDVGCGVGTKLALASFSGFYSFGVEINPAYAEVAKRIVGTDRVVVANAMDHDFGCYDVIYFYCPFMDGEKQAALERHLIETAKPGAIFMANLRYAERLWGPCKCKRAGCYDLHIRRKSPTEWLSECVYQKLEPTAVKAERAKRKAGCRAAK